MGRPPGRKNNAKKAANGAAAPAEVREAAPRKRAASAKEAAAEAPRTNVPTPDERTQWLAELTQLETQKQRISGETSALAKRVKDRGGVKAWKSLKAVHGFLKLEKSEAVGILEDLVVASAQQDIRISWMGNQAAFADVMDQPQSQPPAKASIGAELLAAAKATNDGYNSGKHGATPKDNPYQHAPGSVEYGAWHRGRDDAERERTNVKPAQAKRLKDALTGDSTLPNEQPETSGEPLF